MKLKEFKEMVKKCLNMWESSLANDVAKKLENDTYAKRLMQKCNKVSENTSWTYTIVLSTYLDIVRLNKKTNNVFTLRIIDLK